VPRISFFHGITITMHWNEGAHSRPHFHARSSGRKASFAFDGLVIVRELPRDHRLRLVFEDGLIWDVSFQDHGWSGVFNPLHDPAVFAQVFVDPELGTIAWPNGVDMAPEPLYEAALAHPVNEGVTRRR
jgi:hypothetical protein